MNNEIKVQRASVTIGSFEVDRFMLPDGSCRMSQTQVAEIIGLTERNAREFLTSKTFKHLSEEGYMPAIFEIESEDPRAKSISGIATGGCSNLLGLPVPSQ